MDLYNGFINEINGIAANGRSFPYVPGQACPMTDSGTLILSKDSAFELGGAGLPAVNATLFTTEDMQDEVVLCGKDIGEISSDTPYARVAVICLDSGALPDEDGLYRSLKDVELVKYRVFPEGCLLRLSPESRREQLRVSRTAVKNGLSLKNIGFTFIEQYKKDPVVKAVKIIFFTDKDTDYKALERAASRSAAVTSSLNRIFDGMEISCDTCELKPVCDEVEGLRKLHFGKDV